MGRNSLTLAEITTNFPSLFTTEAFKRRDKEWSFESWDYIEWEECLEEAKEELQIGRIDVV